MAVKNMAASVLTRLKNQARREEIPFQVMLQLFAQEEFLRKLSLSKYADHLILKGGMFIYTYTEFASRPTRDVDFLIRNFRVDIEIIEQIMRDICAVSTGNHYILLKVLGAKTITVDKKYPGVRTSFMGRIEKVRIPFSVDVGVDDLIVPEPIRRSISTRLSDFEPPRVFTYSLESTIAEKFDAILQRMAGTSRMKDFYDIYYLSGIFNFDGPVLKEAIRSTLYHRNRKLYEDNFIDINDFRQNDSLLTKWKAFHPAKKTGLSFEEILDRLIVFLEPVYQSILSGSVFDKKWDCDMKQWM